MLSHVDTAGNSEATPTPVHTNGNVLLQSDVNCSLTGLQCSSNTFTDLKMKCWCDHANDLTVKFNC